MSRGMASKSVAMVTGESGVTSCGEAEVGFDERICQVRLNCNYRQCSVWRQALLITGDDRMSPRVVVVKVLLRRGGVRHGVTLPGVSRRAESWQIAGRSPTRSVCSC
ncbi:hypothetical protein HPP92_012813 [Vanilla planifolia]|uniref:Uncharacterized protein n=1 Tax=Vanilla planifolia TaxID=51239 RepID=A0A835UXT2_VANPL|nr:hypothetical protein HPP92_013236 [Vanilla planifolia]KAG0478094.1 hypothetical protein HPP92_012813 [Vanilla planifolia]